MEKHFDGATALVHSTDRDAWLEARRNGVTASEIPAILGLSSWSSPYAVAAQKSGLEPDVEETELMRWGRLVEPAVLGAFESDEDHEDQVLAADPDGWLYQSKATPWFMATPDGAQLRKSGVRGAVECKLAVYSAADWRDGVPPHVAAQAQAQAYVLDVELVSVCVLLEGYKLRFVDLYRDDEWIADRMLPAAGRFWEALQADLPIPVDGHEATERALKAKFPQHQAGLVVDLSESMADIWDRREEAKAAKKAAEAEERELGNLVKEAIGEAEAGILPDGRKISWKAHFRREHTVKEGWVRPLREVKA